MFLEFAVGALAVVVAYLGWVVSNDKRMLKFYQESLDFTIVSQCGEVSKKIADVEAKINSWSLSEEQKMNKINACLELLLADMTQRACEIPVEGIAKTLPPANRKPRTEEQKRLAAEVKKAWWANRRAEEEKKKAQEQNAITPNVETNVS